MNFVYLTDEALKKKDLIETWIKGSMEELLMKAFYTKGDDGNNCLLFPPRDVVVRMFHELANFVVIVLGAKYKIDITVKREAGIDEFILELLNSSEVKALNESFKYVPGKSRIYLEKSLYCSNDKTSYNTEEERDSVDYRIGSNWCRVRLEVFRYINRMYYLLKKTIELKEEEFLAEEKGTIFCSDFPIPTLKRRFRSLKTVATQTSVEKQQWLAKNDNKSFRDSGFYDSNLGETSTFSDAAENSKNQYSLADNEYVWSYIFFYPNQLRHRGGEAKLALNYEYNLSNKATQTKGVIVEDTQQIKQTEHEISDEFSDSDSFISCKSNFDNNEQRWESETDNESLISDNDYKKEETTVEIKEPGSNFIVKRTSQQQNVQQITENSTTDSRLSLTMIDVGIICYLIIGVILISRIIIYSFQINVINKKKKK